MLRNPPDEVMKEADHIAEDFDPDNEMLGEAILKSTYLIEGEDIKLQRYPSAALVIS